MLSRLGNMGKSMRDLTDNMMNAAKAKINEINALPDSLPESWDERTDENGKPYFVDTQTGEWYRVKSKQHKRIDTKEKLDIITAESKKEYADNHEETDDINTDDDEMDTDNTDDDEHILTNGHRSNKLKPVQYSHIRMANTTYSHTNT